MPGLTFPRVQDYLLSLVPPREPELVAMEKYADETGFPIIGPAAGNFCYQVARQIGAKRVFEMGSGYGYSTAWFARAVRENGGGIVHHVVWDSKLSHKARNHLSRLGFDGVVEYHVAEAVDTLRQESNKFDLIFNDIEKEDYAPALPLIKEQLRHGGVLIIDNMLWSGGIFDPKDQSARTQGIREFTQLITRDPDWIVSLVPIRDGLIVGYKR
jgi:predicted O-methyltransferase YrrM